MNVNDTNSKRKLSIFGNGWLTGKISLEYIGRHSCSSAILDEEDFELEEGKLDLEHKFLSFSNTMHMLFENIDTKERENYEFKHLKKLGIYRGNLDPEDLVLTNSFEKIPNTSINHSEYDDDQYYLEYQETWKGIYGEFNFKKGELFDLNNLDIHVNKLDTGNEFFEWICIIEYSGKKMKKKNINPGVIRKRLRTY
tara:strand:+ start:9719 stop:10306 length:588 start_codon:yes stop_codon:yes gene_type:complete